MGPEGGGGLASAAAIAALREPELLAGELSAGELLDALEDALAGVDGKAGAVARPPGAGTTLTGVLWSGARLALVHIGDSRASLLRGGELYLVTHDHTLVQSLVDDGRLTLAEAASRPQHTLSVRALTGSGDNRPDVSLHTARVGDRYLPCSDGLSRTVPEESLHTALSAIADVVADPAD